MNMQGRTVGEKLHGKMYEVSINAKPEQFLDWDRPLAQQSQPVQEAISSVSNPMYKRWVESGAFPHVKGETLYRELAGGLTNKAHAEGLHVGASASLRDAGIPGIRYLDQGSRWVNDIGLKHPDVKPTSNYVLFRDDIIDILKKWGLIGPAAVAASQADNRQ